MLVIKYEKVQNAKYISHLDLVRHISRICRRAGVSVKFSQGYNPHELIYFAPPSMIGLKSLSEYCTISSDEKSDGFVEKFNAVTFLGLNALNVKNTEKNPNFAAITTHAEYEIVGLNDEQKSALQKAFDSKEYVISFINKEEMKTADIRDMMYSFEFDQNITRVILALGAKTLRIDRFLNSIGKKDLIDVTKTRIFTTDSDGKLVDVDLVY